MPGFCGIGEIELLRFRSKSRDCMAWRVCSLVGIEVLLASRERCRVIVMFLVWCIAFFRHVRRSFVPA